jgi:hypothetical protein
MALRIQLKPYQPNTAPYPTPPTMWAGEGMVDGAEAGVNHGVLHGINPGAHIVGDNRDYQNISLNKKKNYLDFVATPPQPQSGNGGDSLGCTSHGWNRSLEPALTFMYHNGLLSDKGAQFLEDRKYFDENGRVAGDDRILVVESGTTEQGNYMDAVAETSRNRVGLCPARPYDWSGYTRQDYFAIDPKVRAEQLEEGKEFLEHFSIYHRWLLLGSSGAGAAAVISQYLEYGALYAASAVHSFSIIGIEGETISYYDSYNPYIRKAELSRFPQLWLKQVVITEKTDKTPIPHLPYFEKLPDPSKAVYAYDKDTDTMVGIESGEAFHTFVGPYSKVKTVKKLSRPVDSRLLRLS